MIKTNLEVTNQMFRHPNDAETSVLNKYVLKF